MIDVMMVSAQKPCCIARSQPPLPEPTKLHTTHRTLDPSECERYFRHAGYDHYDWDLECTNGKRHDRCN
jgi:hypothetical protein